MAPTAAPAIAPGNPPGALAPAIAPGNPPGALAPAAPETVPPRQAQKPAGDPLLGPNPELMPPIPDVSEMAPVRGKTSPRTPEKPATAPASAAKPTGSNATPAVSELKPPAGPELPELPHLPDQAPAVSAPAAPSQSSPAKTPVPIELELAPAPDSGTSATPGPPAQPAGSGGSAARTEPASAGSVAALPALEAAPGEPAKPAKTIARAAAAAAQEAVAGLPRRDPQVMLTSGEKTEKPDTADAKAKNPAELRRRVVLEQPGFALAKVGEEIITYHDVMALVTQHRAYRQLEQAFNEGDAAQKREVLKQLKMLKMAMLDDLINRSLLVQEAKHQVNRQKDGSKILNAIFEEADQRFQEVELVPLKRLHHLDGEHQVKEYLAEHGRSLAEMQQSFRQMYLAQSYMHTKIRDKIKVDLPDQLKYYETHVAKHEFDRPALITWREIVIEPIAAAPSKSAAKDPTALPTAAPTNREAARQEALAILERLRKGEEFATLARKESDGPSSARNQGGLMETSPGGYGVPAVNQALEILPIGKVSDVIEGPDGFHIVKVEKRRPAGPSSFEEVQNDIKPLIEREKAAHEEAALLAKLRKSTFIKIYSAKGKEAARPKSRTS